MHVFKSFQIPCVVDPLTSFRQLMVGCPFVQMFEAERCRWVARPHVCPPRLYPASNYQSHEQSLGRFLSWASAKRNTNSIAVV